MAEPKIVLLLGSLTDYTVFAWTGHELQALGVPYEIMIVGRSRDGRRLARVARAAERRGAKAFVVAAISDPELLNSVSRYTELPVFTVAAAASSEGARAAARDAASVCRVAAEGHAQAARFDTAL